MIPNLFFEELVNAGIVGIGGTGIVPLHEQLVARGFRNQRHREIMWSGFRTIPCSSVS